ncbi:MAG: hypothetical protein Q9188_001391 [Gyalolechia gomerana]
MTSQQSPRLPSPPASHKPSAFRFKRKHPDDSTSNPPASKRRSDSPSSFDRTHHHRYHSRRHHRSHHHRHARSRSPSAPPQQTLDSETAFRESLFDALADDEGAAFWESIYGQPIHTYTPYRPSSDSHDTEQASLERMTDEEYASYVRARMWEKSHGYIIEERRRREEERIRRKERDEEGRRWEKGVDEALRRGEERRRRNRWKDAWRRYERGWERLKLAKDEGRGEEVSERIPWPVETGHSAHVVREEVEKFFKHAPQLQGPDGKVNLGKALKLERIRWHPDKFLQKAGSQGLDEETIAMVTAVFQIVDRLWSEMRHA